MTRQTVARLNRVGTREKRGRKARKRGGKGTRLRSNEAKDGAGALAVQRRESRSSCTSENSFSESPKGSRKRAKEEEKKREENGNDASCGIAAPQSAYGAGFEHACNAQAFTRAV